MSEYRRITVPLQRDEYEALLALSERQHRQHPRDQAAYMLRIALGLDAPQAVNIPQVEGREGEEIWRISESLALFSSSSERVRQDVDEVWKIVPDIMARLDKLEERVLVQPVRRMLDETT